MVRSSFLLARALALGAACVGAVVAVASDSSNYRVRHGDVLSVAVYQEPELRTEVRVPADGDVILPLIGRIGAHDRTIAELHAQLTQAFNRFLVDPQVTVQVIQYSPAVVQVIGQVNRPGPVPLPPEKPLRLLEAVGAAGGFTNRANARKVFIRRRHVDDTTSIIEIDVDALFSKPETHDVPLQEGDTVFVDQRIV